MTINPFRSRHLAGALAILTMSCGAPSPAWCANLWIAHYNGGGVDSFTSKQLKKSGMPSPIVLSTFTNTIGIAFDKSHNLWAVVDEDEVVRFTAAQLKKLKSAPSPTPGVIITSSSTFKYIEGCNFDHQGNLWVVDSSNDSIDELSKAQLSAGSGNITPNIVIASSDLDGPNFVTFDTVGNAWVDNEGSSTIVEFTASQLTSGGSKSATVVLSDDGSGTSLRGPGQIAFDKAGNLWTPNSIGTVVEYAKDLLTSSGNPAPTVKLTSAVFYDPFDAVFDSNGDLVVSNYGDGTIAKFSAKQLKTSGAPVPKVSVTETDSNNSEILFGPAS